MITVTPATAAPWLPDSMPVRVLFEQAFTVAKPTGLLLNAAGQRDLFGQALHMIGVPDRYLVDRVSASHRTLELIGAVTAWLQCGQLSIHDREQDALQWAQLWGAALKVGDLRAVLLEHGVELEGRPE